MTRPRAAARPWERRLARAAELRALWPFAREVLAFFGEITAFQRDLADRLAAAALPAEPVALAAFLPGLLDLVVRQGPTELARAAAEWRARPPTAGEQALRSFWRGADGGGATERFFPRVLLQPYALARRIGERGEEEPPGAGPRRACPSCGRPPGLSVLREDAAAGATARALACSLCTREWSFPRVLCPGCEEERPEKLVRYAAEEFPWLRVEACDTCRRYLKAIDLTRNAGAEPATDELASTPLDVLAREAGYTKIEPNLAGM